MNTSNYVITISREFGTGGRKIAQMLSNELGIKIYDRHILKALQEKFNLTEEEMNRIKAKRHNWWDDFSLFYQQATAWANKQYYETFTQNITSRQLYQAEAALLKDIAEQEPCIILGRTGFHIFRDHPRAFKVFLVGDLQFRRDNIAKRLNINDGTADKLLHDIDQARENYTLTFADKSRYDSRNYDLVVNVTNLEPEQIALFILDCVKQKFEL